MKWNKIGSIYCVSPMWNWKHSHSAMPIMVQMEDGIGRIFYTTRDANNRSSTSFFEINLAQPQQVIRDFERPLLSPGSIGFFDDSGAMGSCVVRFGNLLRMYYIGWNIGVTTPFRNAIGLAESIDGGNTFRKYSNGPLLDRSIHDACFPSSPHVLFVNGIWKMWYLSCTHWNLVNGQPKHYYHIKYASSHDGLTWKRDGHVCIDFQTDDEHAFGRSTVIFDDHIYKMWYCVRGSAYKLGYAESEDGLNWVRMDDKVGISASEAGWDSEMIAYPYVYRFEDRMFMLYNGNGYGRSGIGLAVLE